MFGKEIYFLLTRDRLADDNKNWAKNIPCIQGLNMENLDARSFQPSMFQASIFTPDMEFSSAKVMSVFYPQCLKDFDADPETIPNMPGMPSEIPRVILRNRSDSFRFEISAARLNFFGRMKSQDKNPIDIKDFFAIAIRLFTIYKNVLDYRLGRLAVVRISYAISENPGLFLARHFCKEIWEAAPLNRPENFELHAHKLYNFANTYNINSWLRSKSGNLIDGKAIKRIILVEQDINTLEEEAKSKSYSIEEIENFYTSIIPEFDKILAQYYPINDGE